MSENVTVGRTVHVNDVVGKCQAAIVADVSGDVINALVIRKTGSAGPQTNVPYSSAEYEPGAPKIEWHWPERSE